MERINMFTKMLSKTTRPVRKYDPGRWGNLYYVIKERVQRWDSFRTNSDLNVFIQLNVTPQIFGLVLCILVITL